jgi:hypothetical protein
MHALRFSCLVAICSALSSAGCGDSGTTGATGSTGSAGAGTCTPGTGCPMVKSDCIGLVDNTSANPFALRFSHLTVNTPSVLKGPIVKGLLDGGVTINLPQCMSNTKPPNPFFPAGATALGTFSWILQFDKTAGTLTTGGAKPVTDPTAGYCFVNETIQGFAIKPLMAMAPIGADGSFSVTMPQDVAVPVYSDMAATSVILLPLRQVTIQGKLSSDHNCIGTLNPMLDPTNNCLPDMNTPQFVDGGSLQGFTSLDDADKVSVTQLGGKSLCLILANDPGCSMYCDSTKTKCARDATGAILFQGDWCSTGTGSAATPTCHDAVHLTANFAASSVPMKATCP